ncbi:hypothetical protein FRB94_010055 [Tulasnella sp. JGI-2019a]|nr:hypothetical protein FRB93_007243 [Tulasnella sp. JGI-2019a]KAG8994205.1 hypothetical protein FRB94_010055 [Tulasnella sp. JGI-2019a]
MSGMRGRVLCKNSHRYASSHACPGSAPGLDADEKNAKAKALLAKAFPSMGEAKATKPATSPSPISSPSAIQSARKKPLTASQKKVELMRMRHKAVPIDPRFERKGVTIPSLENRRFFKAKALDKGAESEEKVFWSVPDMIGGRVLDNLGRILKVGNGNSPTQLQRLVDDVTGGSSVEPIELQLSVPIGEQTEDGDTLLLVIIDT